MRNAGDDVIRVADERRAVLAGYWSHFESVDAQVKKALDQNNWKIFGRVISRQSLLALSRDLDDIRRGSTQLNTRRERRDARFAGAKPDALRRDVGSERWRGSRARRGRRGWRALRKEFGAVLANREQAGAVG